MSSKEHNSAYAEGEFKDLTGKALKLVVVNYASRFLGLVRTMAMVAVFGASTDVDIFFGTFGAVLVFFEIIPQAFTQAFVPIYSKFVVEKKPKEFNSLSLYYTLSGTAIILAIFLVMSGFADHIVTKIFVFGDTSKAHIALGMVLFRYSLLVMLLNYFIGNFSAILYAKEQVVVPALINLLKNLIVIVAIIFWHEDMGISSVAMGFTVGSIVQMFYLLWLSIRSGWRVNFTGPFPTKMVGYMWRLFIPAFLGLAVAQLNIVIDRYFASALKSEGQVAILSFANILISLITVFTTSLTVAVFPKYSHSVSKAEIGELEEMLSRALRALFFFIIPIMVLVALISSPLVFSVFNIGKMGEDPANLVLLQDLFRIFCVWVIFYSINYQLLMVFFSFGDTMTPMLISAFNVCCNVFFDWLFTMVFHFGVQGIVASTTLSVVLTTVLVLFLVYPKVGKVLDMRILKGMTRIVTACVPMVAVIILFNIFMHAGIIYESDGVFFKDLAYIAATTILGIAAYCWASLKVNPDLTLYFFRNWRTFFRISNHK